MRLLFGLLLIALAVIMAGCAVIARKSRKEIGKASSLMLIWTIPPVLGNAILILSSNYTLSLIGSYVYFLGMDLIIAAMLHFTMVYCQQRWKNLFLRNVTYALLLTDVVQMLLNPVFGHAFELKEIELNGYPYYSLVPYFGQTFHRLAVYSILAGIIVVFAIKVATVPQLQRERYSVILFSMIVVTIWESAYIFSGTPMDRSMIGMAVFALMLFYFSLYYRPMRLLDRMLGRVVSQQKEAIFFFDENQKCLWMNEAGKNLLKLTDDDLGVVGETLEATFGARHVGETMDWADHVTLKREEGDRMVELSRHAFLDRTGKVIGFYIEVRDETEEHNRLAQSLYNARHDRLTGLYNSDYLFERTRELLDQDPEGDYLIVYADINDFKMINDIYGYDFGDLALKRTAEWVAEDLPERSACGRLGGDTFGVCLTRDGFNQVRTENKISRLFVSDRKRQRQLVVHLGVYPVTDRTLDVSVMFDRAHMALNKVKNEAHLTTGWYEDSMRDQVLWNQRITTELPEAIARGEIRPWLQPIMNEAGKMIGAEALVRWVHPTDGVRSPASFIPVFEQNGMIADVDLHIWRSSCAILRKWRQEGRDAFISVNISPKDFLFLDVGGVLKGLVSEYGIDSRKLRIEITETVMMTDMEKRMDVLRDLRENGFIIEMDDFGSGYSSLNMLKDMPVDVLKIDMAFLRRSGDAIHRAKTIVREIIALARALGITSLTEGVETEEQYHGLREMGCQLYQGYYFARPMPEEDFEERYRSA